MSRLPENLKLIRKKRWRMSQDKFADLMGSSRSKINSYENGGVEPSIAFMVKLQVFSGISIKDIFIGELEFNKIPPLPLSEENNSLEKVEEELPSYDKGFLHLKYFHGQMTKRFQSLEKRIKTLESNED
ncbi:MAG: helix-turn-helix transcriptional regulator [Saprospiraceae bacterium]